MDKIPIFMILGPCLISAQLFENEAVFTINSKKAVNSVSDNFLSVSLDPAVLLAGLNLNNTSLELARHLSPAFIRIAGPSTQFVHYQSDEISINNNEAEANQVLITPSMWFGLNEWLHSANLTPIFGVNDFSPSNDDEHWNPKSVMPLLEISDKFNISCYWQLGYDCSNKSESRYLEDLKHFRSFLVDNFPGKANTWKIVGSDLSKCVGSERVRKLCDDLKSTTAAIFWNQEPFLTKAAVPLWKTLTKTNHPVSFGDALSWAKEIGEAAKNGYEVVFRQPRLLEIFAATPAYWVSVLHKNLMGRTVLDVKGTKSIPIYAHCTKNQNNFVRSGAVTILAVNEESQNRTVLLRLSSMLKSTEVQSFILTSTSEDATDCFLNDEKLRLRALPAGKLNFTPKLRRARIMNYLALTLPAKSVAFFVLPTVHFPVCSDDGNIDEILQEIDHDQNVQFADEQVEVVSRFPARKHSTTLKELQDMMKKELESDERYYSNLKATRRKYNPVGKAAEDNITPKDARQYFIERAKLAQRKHYDTNELKKVDLTRLVKPAEERTKEYELELTSGEIRKILSDRAKKRAAKKNILFTSAELDQIMKKATEKILKNRNASIKIKRRNQRDINMRLLKLKSLPGESSKLQSRNRKKHTKPRPKRDINLDLLKLKADLVQKRKPKPVTNFRNKEEKQATLKQSGQMSVEIKEAISSPLPDEDVFAQMADEIAADAKEDKPKMKFNLSKLFKSKQEPVKWSEQADKKNAAAFPCIHEFFGTNIPRSNFEQARELWEEPPKITTEKINITSRLLHAKNAEDLRIDSINDYDNLDTSDDESPLRLRRNLFENLMDLQTKRSINDRYKSLTDNLKAWKPSNIVNYKTTKSKRSIGNDLSPMDNNIDVDNYEEKSVNDGDYQLVFPANEIVKEQATVQVKVQNVTKDGSNIQKIAKEHGVWEKFFSKMSFLLNDLTVKLKSILEHFLSH